MNCNLLAAATIVESLDFTVELTAVVFRKIYVNADFIRAEFLLAL